jgi:hypothetical protein
MPRPRPQNITETGSIFLIDAYFFSLIDYLPLIILVVSPLLLLFEADKLLEMACRLAE